MTVSTSASSITYLGSGVTTAFPFPYPLRDATHLRVYNDGVLQSGTYTVSGVGTPSSAVVTYTTAPAAGVEILLDRVVPYTQLSDYVENDPLPAATLESDFDLIAMGLQQLSEGFDHTLRVPVGEVVGDMTLPSKAERASKIFAFDAAGLPIALSALDQSALTVTPSPGGTPRFLGDIFGEYINVKNFGAAGDGVQDDTAECLAAIAAAPMSGGTIYFPSGTYILTSPLLSMGKSIYFAGEGQHTILRFTGCDGIVIDNTAAAFKLPCGVHSLRIQTTDTGDGTALWFTGPPNEPSIEPQVTIRDVFIEGHTNATCWETGINVVSAAQSNIDNFVIRGSTSDHTLMFMGLRFDAVSTDVKVSNGSVTWVNFGMEVAGASESVILFATHLVQCNVGAIITSNAGGHHFVIDQSHVAAFTNGIILGNAADQQGPNHSRITDNFFIRLPAAIAYVGLSLFSSRNIVTGNEFTFNVAGQSEIGIHVNGEVGVPAQWNLIANNLIFNCDTAIFLDANSNGNVVINNMGSDNPGKVIDNGVANTVHHNQFDDTARKEFRASFTYDPAGMAAGDGTETTTTVLGALLGDFVSVAPPYATSGVLIMGVVEAVNTVRIALLNFSGSTVELGSGTWNVTVWRE